MNHAISVIIPTYKGSNYILDALDSIRKQELLPNEIIVVDDCSPDNTIEVVKKAALDFPVPLHIIPLEKNSGGPSHPINVGIKIAQGDFIGVLDQDDIWLPDHLKLLYGLLEKHPDCSLAAGFCANYETPEVPWIEDVVLSDLILGDLRFGGNNSKKAFNHKNYLLIDQHRIHGLFLKHHNFLRGYPAFLFRKKDWEKKHGVDENLKICGDFEFLCWLSRQGNAIFVPRPVYLRREHQNNASKFSGEGHFEVIKVLTDNLKVFPNRYPGDALISNKFSGFFMNLSSSARDYGLLLVSFKCLLNHTLLEGWSLQTIRRFVMIVPGRIRDVLNLYFRKSSKLKVNNEGFCIFRDYYLVQQNNSTPEIDNKKRIKQATERIIHDFDSLRDIILTVKQTKKAC